MKVVIDTNVLVSSFQNPDGNPKKIIDMWKRGDFIFCISEAILLEYIEVLDRMNIPKQKIKEMAELFKMRAYVEIISDTIRIDIIKDDPNDNKFIECAVAANAQYIISGDKHLKALKEYGNIKILSPSEFLNL
ncbi:MAG: putative toxin-antitoxin system toxin component, PIN family [Deltaproteobacteria bacterium]|nr:putative toxin-antitoxin system toxin component, PIN family [Deltaproteobacteria bacterium]